MARSAKPKISDFEKSLKELEAIVERMEKGEQTLEASLKDFERGNSLAEACRVSLEDAEQRIEKLTPNDKGELVAELFPIEDGNIIL